MVDALLIAAQSEDSEYFEDKEDDVPQLFTPSHRPHHTQSQVRICEFCGSSNTPTWRRGPGGKGSLCNACGIKWRLRKRTKKGDTVDNKVKTTKSPTTKRKKRDTKEDPMDHMTTIRNPIVFRENMKETNHEMMHNNTVPLSPSSFSPSFSPPSSSSSPPSKNYFCKFCNKTWDTTHFKNSQQFGAHCSNCSRRPMTSHALSPLGDGLVPPSPSLDDLASSPPTSTYLTSPPLAIPTPTKRFPPPPFEDPGLNLILMLRYMQEEADLSDGETLAPLSPSTLSPPVS